MHTVAITEAVNRYFAALDQKQFDVTTLSQIFAEDAKIVRPAEQSQQGQKPLAIVIVIV